jgi:hypothetical protein
MASGIVVQVPVRAGAGGKAKANLVMALTFVGKKPQADRQIHKSWPIATSVAPNP